MLFSEGTLPAVGDIGYEFEVASDFSEQSQLPVARIVFETLEAHGRRWDSDLARRLDGLESAPGFVSEDRGNAIIGMIDDRKASPESRNIALGIIFTRDPMVFQLATQEHFGDGWLDAKIAALAGAPGRIRKMLAHDPKTAHWFSTLAAEWLETEPIYEDAHVISSVAEAAPHLKNTDKKRILEQVEIGRNLDTFNGCMLAGFKLLTEPTIPLSMKKALIAKTETARLDEMDIHGKETVRVGMGLLAYYLMTGLTLSHEKFYSPTGDDQKLGQHIIDYLFANPPK